MVWNPRTKCNANKEAARRVMTWRLALRKMDMIAPRMVSYDLAAASWACCTWNLV